jgi:hypothetical protein
MSRGKEEGLLVDSLVELLLPLSVEREDASRFLIQCSGDVRKAALMLKANEVGGSGEMRG